MADKDPKVPGHPDPTPPSQTPGSSGPGNPKEGGHSGEVPKKEA